MIGFIIFFVLVGLFISPFVFRKRIGHDLLGWHDCEPSGTDGVSATGICKYCGQKCLQDSQGNWF